MTATPAYGFPWTSHLTLRESDEIERACDKYGEAAIFAQLRADLHAEFMVGNNGTMRSASDLLAYLIRNPRKPKDAA